MINKVILEGRVTKDIEIRYTQTNKPVASWTIALNRGKDKNGNDLGVDFINVVTWDKQAEFMNNWFKKGDPVVVIGRLQQRTWDDNGVKHSVTEVVSESVTFPENKKVGPEPVKEAAQQTFSVGADDLPF